MFPIWYRDLAEKISSQLLQLQGCYFTESLTWPFWCLSQAGSAREVRGQPKLSPACLSMEGSSLHSAPHSVLLLIRK